MQIFPIIDEVFRRRMHCKAVDKHGKRCSSPSQTERDGRLLSRDRRVPLAVSGSLSALTIIHRDHCPLFRFFLGHVAKYYM